MAKEFFSYPETDGVFKLLEETSQRSGVSRAVAFEDFLTMSVCSLSGGRMEEEYLRTVEKHAAGKPGKRGCDSIARMFAELVTAMEQDTHDEMKDILGDLFQGAITYGEAGQFLTPMPICELMASLTIGAACDATMSPNDFDASGAELPQSPIEPAAAPLDGKRTVHDPCCGSGRMLLAAARINRHWEFIGQDVDRRCVQMTCLNLAFRNLYGFVIWGNTLRLEQKLVYRTGFDGLGFVREISFESCPAPVHRAVQSPTTTASQVPPTGKGQQLELF